MTAPVQDQSQSAAEDPPHFRLLNEIAIVEQLASRLFERVMPQDLTLPQFKVLNHFVRRPQPSSPARLARAFQLGKPAMTHTVQQLVAKGYVKAAPDPQDERGKLIALTPAGREARDRAVASLAPILGRLGAAIAADEVAAVMPTLTRLRSWLDEERDGGAAAPMSATSEEAVDRTMRQSHGGA